MSFQVVAGLGLAMIVSVLVAVPESLPAERCHGGGLSSFAVAGRQVLGQRRYLGYLLVSGSVMGALFAYVATSAFVLQGMNGCRRSPTPSTSRAAVPEHPGTGFAVLGFVQWVAAGLVAPLVGLGGAHTAVPMAVLLILGAAVSMFGLLVLARAGDRARIFSPEAGVANHVPVDVGAAHGYERLTRCGSGPEPPAVSLSSLLPT